MDTDSTPHVRSLPGWKERPVCGGPTGSGRTTPETTDTRPTSHRRSVPTPRPSPLGDIGRTAVHNLGTTCANRPTRVCTLGGQPCGPAPSASTDGLLTCLDAVHRMWRRETSGRVRVHMTRTT